jgi:hypothetical protein
MTIEQIFRVTAEGDTIYIAAFCLEDAKRVFQRHFGDVPDLLLRWKVVNGVPEDEDVLR